MSAKRNSPCMRMATTLSGEPAASFRVQNPSMTFRIRPPLPSSALDPRRICISLPAMAISRLHPDTTVLIVIDIQEHLVSTIIDRDRLVTNSAIMLRVASELGIPYFVTEQYPQGLGRTVDEIATAMTDPSRRVEKTRFSAAVDVITDQLATWRRSSVIICGIEAQVCVLQTVLDLQHLGYHCFLCTDAISAGQHGQIAPAIRRMERAGAIPSGVLSIMYELMGGSKHSSFRALLELAKQVKQ